MNEELYPFNEPLIHTVLKHELYDLLDVLLENGADVNLQMRVGDNTPLLEAVNAGAPPAVIRRLLEAGGDPNIPNFSGATPFTGSITKNGLDETSLLLLAYGGDKTRRMRLGTLPRIVQLLLNDLPNLPADEAERLRPLLQDALTILSPSFVNRQLYEILHRRQATISPESMRIIRERLDLLLPFNRRKYVLEAIRRGQPGFSENKDKRPEGGAGAGAGASRKSRRGGRRNRSKRTRKGAH